MLKIAAATAKELLLLLRDRTGLLVLFLMPAILVVVITLVQENVMELTGQKKNQLLFLDLDHGYLGVSLKKQLETGSIYPVTPDDTQQDIAAIRAAVTEGVYQAGIVIPAGASSRFRLETARLFQQGATAGTHEETTATTVYLFIDPGAMPGLRSAIAAQLRMALASIALEAKLAMLGGALHDADTLPSLFRQPLLALAENEADLRADAPAAYNPVQQNVPAWALFGMFFTAIPIAGSILTERNSGIWIRLSALPVSPLVLFTGKTVAYIGICLCQFLLIVLIGAFLFPHIGLPAFSIAINLPAILLTAVLSGLAASGYGIFLGMACTSYEQASTIGATMVVAAAALGGVMVPVYAMPHAMQRLSIISPLNWGLTAFQDILLRGYSIAAILDDLGRLFLFFAVTALLSWKLAGTTK